MPKVNVNKPMKLPASLRAELDSLRGGKTHGYELLTDEQKAVLLYMRSNPTPVTWKNIIKYWGEQGWEGGRGYLIKQYGELVKGAK